MALTVTPSAVTSAIAGTRAASLRLDSAAANVMSASAPVDDTVSISDGARTAAQGGGSAGAVATAMVDLRVARYQNAASIAVLHTADDMNRDLLTLGGDCARTR
jgi:hypothetical protein